MTNFVPKESLYATYAAKAYRNSDSGRWVAAHWSQKIVGNYERYQTKNLAEFIGVSVDTVENLAHAYEMYSALRDDPEFSRNTRLIRRKPYIYTSHFVALYKAWKRYNMELHEVYSILVDVWQAQGKLSSRDVDKHVRDHYGKERNWQYYAERTMQVLFSLRQCPDVPSDVRKETDELYSFLGEKA